MGPRVWRHVSVFLVGFYARTAFGLDTKLVAWEAPGATSTPQLFILKRTALATTQRQHKARW